MFYFQIQAWREIYKVFFTVFLYSLPDVVKQG